MRIPFWQRGQAHPTKAIDRLQNHRASRQIIGVWVDDNFSRVTASLVQVKGSGKFSRFGELQTAEVELESSAQQILQEVVRDENPGEVDIQFAGSELAVYQANCCRLLLSRTNTQASDIVALGVTDPGIRLADFEGREHYRSLTNAMELASRTSITVIDRFPERDILDGGNGTNLFALGYWFLLGDRSPKIAEENRLLVLACDGRTMIYYLPASDGLDSVLPEIEVREVGTFESPGQADALKQWVAKYFEHSQPMSLRVVANSPLPFPVSEIDDTICFSLLDEFSIHRIEPVASAFLANAFVDQLPVSIPDITGNPNPRVLGCLTPGSLVNFRNYVLQASKVSPAIMKLRDAV